MPHCFESTLSDTSWLSSLMVSPNLMDPGKGQSFHERAEDLCAVVPCLQILEIIYIFPSLNSYSKQILEIHTTENESEQWILTNSQVTSKPKAKSRFLHFYE